MDLLEESMVVSMLTSLIVESFSICTESIRKGTIPGWTEYIAKYGKAAAVGALSGAVAYQVGLFASMFADGIGLGMAASGTSASVGQAIDEFIDFAAHNKEITFRDAAGNVFKAGFAGLVTGGIALKIWPVRAKCYDIINLKYEVQEVIVPISQISSATRGLYDFLAEYFQRIGVE